MILAGGDPATEITAASLPGEVAPAGGGNGGSGLENLLTMPLREAREAFERTYFEHHLAQANGSIARLAERSGLERTHLYRKLKALGILARRKED
jgi:two-component system nitrogen regulation response regulator NtrX